MRKVAIVLGTLSHYRESIYNLLCCSDILHCTFYSEYRADGPVKPIDPAKAAIPVEEGGLRWRFLKQVNLGGPFMWQRGVLSLFFYEDYDVFIFMGNMYYLSTWVGCAIARMRGKRVFMWTHGFRHHETGIKGFLRRTFYSLAHSILLYGNRARDIMITMGFDPERLYVIYNSLDYDKQLELRTQITREVLDETRAHLFSTPESPVLIYIGRLTASKNLDILLHAARELKSQGIACSILFVGDGPARNEIKDMARTLDLSSNVVFYGACYNEDEIAPLLMMSNICVSPGSIGLTCMHALVYGTPVITHNNFDDQKPEHEAIEPGVNGMFYEQGYMSELVDVIKEWLKTHPDREAVRPECYKVIDRYYNPHYQIKVIEAAVRGVPSSSVGEYNSSESSSGLEDSSQHKEYL